MRICIFGLAAVASLVSGAALPEKHWKRFWNDTSTEAEKTLKIVNLSTAVPLDPHTNLLIPDPKEIHSFPPLETAVSISKYVPTSKWETPCLVKVDATTTRTLLCGTEIPIVGKNTTTITVTEEGVTETVTAETTETVSVAPVASPVPPYKNTTVTTTATVSSILSLPPYKNTTVTKTSTVSVTKVGAQVASTTSTPTTLPIVVVATPTTKPSIGPWTASFTKNSTLVTTTSDPFDLATILPSILPNYPPRPSLPDAPVRPSISRPTLPIPVEALLAAAKVTTRTRSSTAAVTKSASATVTPKTLSPLEAKFLSVLQASRSAILGAKLTTRTASASASPTAVSTAITGRSDLLAKLKAFLEKTPAAERPALLAKLKAFLKKKKGGKKGGMKGGKTPPGQIKARSPQAVSPVVSPISPIAAPDITFNAEEVEAALASAAGLVDSSVEEIFANFGQTADSLAAQIEVLVLAIESAADSSVGEIEPILQKLLAAAQVISGSGPAARLVARQEEEPTVVRSRRPRHHFQRRRDRGGPRSRSRHGWHQC